MFMKDVYNLFDNPEYAINTLIRIFGHDYRSRNIHHFTQDYILVFSVLNKKIQKLNEFMSER